MRTVNRNSASLAVAGVAVMLGASIVVFGGSRLAAADQRKISIGGTVQAAQVQTHAQYTVRRRTQPARTEIFTNAGKLVAVMTDGTRTAHVQGSKRTFAESRFTPAKIINTDYVRLAPREWTAAAVNEPWFAAWLPKAIADKSPDILDVAFEYTYGSPARKEKNGRQFTGDASFGPLSNIDPDGRAENSDFYDYLGADWEFPDGVEEKANPTHALSLDCSGFLRMVYGYRHGYPLRGSNTKGPGLPRRALAMAATGPGVQLMPNTGKRATDLDRLMPGDLLFFNAGPVQNKHIEHSGLYLGVDDRGHRRFISSRSQANGPTMGDLSGESILDGSGYWAVRLRTARRI